jgi:3D (Asp-Asp-Asp) domain-containing protein
MRRNALRYALPILCAVLAVGAIDSRSKAEELLYDVPRAHFVTMEVTAYCPCKKCCGPKARGITASGRRVSHNNGQFVAADTSILPFNSKLIIPGYAAGQIVEVLDKGGAIKGKKLDVFFATHDEALKWGRRMMEVIIFE